MEIIQSDVSLSGKRSGRNNKINLLCKKLTKAVEMAKKDVSKQQGWNESNICKALVSQQNFIDEYYVTQFHFTFMQTLSFIWNHRKLFTLLYLCLLSVLILLISFHLMELLMLRWNNFCLIKREKKRTKRV